MTKKMQVYDVQSRQTCFVRCCLKFRNEIKSITLPQTVKIIESNAFSMCSALDSFKVPNNVTEIRDGTFYGCTDLTSVDFPENLKKIGNNAFMSCSSLSSAVIPDGVTEIGDSAFAYCNKLSSVNLPTSLESLEGYGFNNCSSLESIEIPENVKKLDTNTFFGCNLSCITVNNPDMEIISTDDYVLPVEMICGHKDSTAQKYAEQYDIDFSALSFISGDANLDGMVNLADVVLIMQSLANPSKYGINGSEPSHITLQGINNADVIGNDGMTNLDALTIQKYKLGLVDSLPVEE